MKADPLDATPYFVRGQMLVRRALLELGERLVRRGTLDDRDDIFFLRLDELEVACAGGRGFDARPLVVARRAECERNRTRFSPSGSLGANTNAGLRPSSRSCTRTREC